MIYTDKDFVLLYAHNVPVKGDDEGVIYDLQKGRLLHIPADIVDVFNDSRKLNMGQLKKNTHLLMNPSWTSTWSTSSDKTGPLSQIILSAIRP